MFGNSLLFSGVITVKLLFALEFDTGLADDVADPPVDDTFPTEALDVDGPLTDDDVEPELDVADGFTLLTFVFVGVYHTLPSISTYMICFG
jgi:hypothetical protein